MKYVMIHFLTFIYELIHRSTNTGLGSTTSAPRGGDIEGARCEVNPRFLI